MHVGHLYATFHQAEGAETCLKLYLWFWKYVAFYNIAIVIELAQTYQSKVGGGNDPVYGEGGEQDEGS